MLEHGAVVTGDERLALSAVDEHGLDWVAAHSVELRPHGEGRAAETDNTALAQSLEEAVKVMDLGRLHVGALLHPAVALNAHGDGLAVRLDRLDRAGDRGMDGRGVSAVLVGDKLADENMLTDLNNGGSRAAGVHIHRQQHLRRGGDANRRHWRSLLVVGQFQR